MPVASLERRRVLPLVFALFIVAGIAAIPGSIAGSSPGPYLGTLELAINGGNNQTGTVTLISDASLVQTISTQQGCNVVTDQSLLSISGNKTLGLKSGGLGIRSKGPGESCGQVQDSETLTIALGTDASLNELSIARAALDLEVKGNVIVNIATSLFDTPQDAFTLNTGQNASDPYADAFATSTSLNPVAECNGGSDSRPDSRDNCRWTLDPDVPFDSFTINVTGSGSVSLEGGADVPEGGSAAPTKFDLVNAPDGILDCGEEAVQGNAHISAVITRLDNPDGSRCNLKPYQFDVVNSGEATELLFVPEGGDAAAYSGAITGVLDDAGPFNQWIEYDPDGAGPDDGFREMEWCIDSSLSTTEVGGEVVRLVDTATLPVDETWCVAALDVVE